MAANVEREDSTQKEKEQVVVVGILAMQSAFPEHQVMLQKLKLPTSRSIHILLIQTTETLEKCDALIIPGEDSTTIALLARLAGLLEPLRDFVKKKPVWGSCAGAILLSKEVLGTKKDGQETLGGVSVTTQRNGWGPKVESFEAPLQVECIRESNRPFTGIFIRAPVVLSVDPTAMEDPIQIIARLTIDRLPKNQTLVSLDEDDTDPRDPRTIAALRQGCHLLTTFHPEFTKDDRFHDYFIRECVLPTLPKS